jgi:hypothetical protein
VRSPRSSALVADLHVENGHGLREGLADVHVGVQPQSKQRAIVDFGSSALETMYIFGIVHSAVMR